jgi:hypothetical protein
MSHTNSDIVTEVVRATPPVTVGGLTLFGVGLSDWVLLLTLVYTALQVYFLLRDKWYTPRKARNGRK